MANQNPSQIQQYLGGLDYPADREQIVEHAQSRGADDQVLQALRNLPQQRFNSPTEVSQAFGGNM